MRGEEAIEAPTAAIPRITPACAGRRRFGSPRGPRSEDHPRVCGEKEIIRRYGDEDGGSPPRVRGEASLVDSIPARTGITPACAGRSRKSLARTAGVEDHPRVCGEKVAPSPPAIVAQGSPPRVRGEAVSGNPVTCTPGITPACAGRSSVRFENRRRSRDHPRVCGEKLAFFAFSGCILGSPPRVRGEAQVVGGEERPNGITPACAGRSEMEEKSGQQKKDHPRVCGEKISAITSCAFGMGSPPRVRGEEPQRGGGQSLHRITPACAGRSLCAVPHIPAQKDHPRVCGEKYAPSRQTCTGIGSPPRVRGEDRKCFFCNKKSRITPACAGRSR